MRKRRDRAAQDPSQGRRQFTTAVHRDEPRFVEVYGESGSEGKSVQQGFEVGNRGNVSAAEDKGIVGVLQNGAREGRVNGVGEPPLVGSTANETLKDIRNDNKKVGGERVSLTQAVATKDPVPRNIIQENRGVTGRQNSANPTAPLRVKTPSREDGKEAGLVDGVERLPEIDFKHHSRSSPGVANAKKVSSVDNILRDAAAREEPGLIGVN